MLVPNALAVLGRAYPPGLKKNLVFALFGTMAPWGFVVGAACAAVFSELIWWPWTFWSYGGAAWALAAFALMVVPKSLGHDAHFTGRKTRPDMDWAGSVTGVVGLVLINVAWNNGSLFGWSKPYVYFILLMGLMALVGFVWVEARAVSPLLPVKAMNGTVVYTMVLLALAGEGTYRERPRAEISC